MRPWTLLLLCIAVLTVPAAAKPVAEVIDDITRELSNFVVPLMILAFKVAAIIYAVAPEPLVPAEWKAAAYNWMRRICIGMLVYSSASAILGFFLWVGSKFPAPS